MSTPAAATYAKPDVLVSTEWLAAHLKDQDIRVVESNEDTLLYASGHIPGAAHVDWTADLNDQIRRDYITREGFEALMSKIGATPDTTIVFYGDKNNWWATYAFWVFQLFGHTKAKVLHGARAQRQDHPRLPRRRAEGRPGEGATGRRPQPRRVQRQASAHARLPERGRTARRPHPRREERAVGPCRQHRGRHVQERRRV